jgi:hypothetical protein
MTNAKQILHLPRRTDSASWADIERTLGIKRVCAAEHTQHGNFCQCEMPTAGWQIVDSDVSPYQKRLVNPDGVQVAKLFYKESFHSGSMQLMVPISEGAAAA